MTDKELYEEIISLLEECEDELLFNPWNKPCPRTKKVIYILKERLVFTQMEIKNRGVN